MYSWDPKMHHKKAWKRLSASIRQSKGRSWFNYHLPPPCPPVSGLLSIFLKQNIKAFRTVSQAQYVHPCTDKDSMGKESMRVRFVIHFDFKTGNEMYIKLTCQLLSVSAPLSNCYDLCIGVHLPSRPEDLTWSRAGNWRAKPCNW